MARWSITLHDYIRSEMQNRGYNEFIVNQKWDSTAGFMLGLLNEKEEYIPVMKEIIFNKFEFTTPVLDDWFKLTFLYSFFDYKIKFETIDVFKSHLYAYLYTNKRWIEEVWRNYNDIFSGHSETTGDSNGTNKANNTNTLQDRYLNADLPQDTPSMNLNSNVIKYPSSTQARLNKNVNVQDANTTNKSNTKSDKLNISDIMTMKEIFPWIFRELDRKLFSQIL